MAKLQLLNAYRDRDGLDWDDAKLHLIDLQYADLRPEKGLYHRLVKLGRMKRLVADDVVEEAMHEPPEDTRAYFRGRCLEQVRRQHRRRLLGLGDLRPAGPRVPAAGPDHRPPARQPGAARHHDRRGDVPRRRGDGR